MMIQEFDKKYLARYRKAREGLYKQLRETEKEINKKNR